jgi:hypothetical protein
MVRDYHSDHGGRGGCGITSPMASTVASQAAAIAG